MILKMQCTFQLFHTFFQASQDQNHRVAATALLAAGGHRLDAGLVTRMIPRFHQYCLVNHKIFTPANVKKSFKNFFKTFIKTLIRLFHLFKND
jgi:hypothetical protein